MISMLCRTDEESMPAGSAARIAHGQLLQECHKFGTGVMGT